MCTFTFFFFFSCSCFFLCTGDRISCMMKNGRWTMSGWHRLVWFRALWYSRWMSRTHTHTHTYAALHSLIGSGCRSWMDGADFWKPSWGRFEFYDRVSPSIPSFLLLKPGWRLSADCLLLEIDYIDTKLGRAEKSREEKSRWM